MKLVQFIIHVMCKTCFNQAHILLCKKYFYNSTCYSALIFTVSCQMRKDFHLLKRLKLLEEVIWQLLVFVQTRLSRYILQLNHNIWTIQNKIIIKISSMKSVIIKTIKQKNFVTSVLHLMQWLCITFLIYPIFCINKVSAPTLCSIYLYAYEHSSILIVLSDIL